MALRDDFELVIKDKPTELERLLYLSLRITQCRCILERSEEGIPLWRKNTKTGTLERACLEQCSRCAAVEEYEGAYGVEPQELKP